MPTITHSSLTTTDLHEPKGASSASAEEVYVADGVGSGAWTPRHDTYMAMLTSVSTASSFYLPIAYAGVVKKITSVIEGTIATADATITIKNSAGSSMGTITVDYVGSAAGDIDTLDPSSNNIVVDNDYITIETNGASTNAVRMILSVVVERS